MATTSAQVQQLYVAYLGRAADKAGLDYWMAELNASPAVLTLENLRANFVNEQPEYSDAYAGLSRQDTVIKIYNNLFGRAPDAAGLTYWTTGAGATVNADQLLTAFVNGASAADAKVIANKVLVAEVYTSSAGDNYTKADATSIIADVDGTSGSVGDALDNLENGSLPGLAIPAGLAAVKAAAIAEKAVTDLETSQTTPLTDLNKAVIALNEKAGEPVDPDDLTITGTGVAGAVTYSDAVAAVAHAQTLRSDISGSSTATLQANVTNANAAFTTARDAFTKADVGNVDLTVKYEAAFTANAGLKSADAAAVTLAEGKVAVDFTAANTGTALADANTAAGLVGPKAVTDTASLYSALTNPAYSAVQVKAISDAFGTFLGTAGANDFAALKTLAATDYTKNVAEAKLEAAFDAADDAGGSAYLSAYNDKAVATDTLANATAADALVSQAHALTVAHDAAVEASVNADNHVPAFAHDLVASTSGVDGADLFYFAHGVTGTDDFTITAFNKGDALYIGEGYSLTSGVTKAADGTFVGTNVSTKEVFFLQDKTTGVVSAVIETNAVGHASGGSDANVAIITLAGVTSLSDVSYANGVITSNHAA
jgi:hypothetical protein